MERNNVKKQLTNINGFPVEFISYSDEKGDPCFAIYEEPSKKGSTAYSLDLLQAVRSEFGEFRKAAVQKVGSHLVLIDDRGNELHLTGCTCGYHGTGPRGTLEALNGLGFKVDRRFVFSSTSFTLKHPSICEYYLLDIEQPISKN